MEQSSVDFGRFKLKVDIPSWKKNRYTYYVVYLLHITNVYIHVRDVISNVQRNLVTLQVVVVDNVII